MISGQFAAEPLLRLIQAPENILRDATLYLRIYMFGYPFLLLYDFGSAVLRARGDSRYPFFVLALSGAANVVLNLFFVIVFRMGVAGFAEYLEDALSDYAEAEKADFDLIHGLDG